MATGTIFEESTATERRRMATPALTMGMFGRRISWAAIIAGVVATTFIQFLLSFLGTGIGANIVDSMDILSRGVAQGAVIWVFVSTLISLYIGGWMAGRLSGIPRKTEGVLHGFLTASLGTIATVLVLTGAVGGVAGMASNMIGQVAQGAAGNETVAAQASETVGAVADRVENMNPQQIQQQAGQAVQTAAPGVAAAGYGAFLLLLLGCLAAMLGGFTSAPAPMYVEEPRARELSKN